MDATTSSPPGAAKPLAAAAAPPPTPHGGSADEWAHIRALQSTLEGRLGESLLLFNKLSARLKEHERKVVATYCPPVAQQLSTPSAVGRLESKKVHAHGGDVGATSPRELDGAAPGPLDQEAAWWHSEPSANSKHSADIKGTDILASMDRRHELASMRTRNLTALRSLSRQLRRKDVAALEVLQGWRSKLPEDFSGLMHNASVYSFGLHLRSARSIESISCALVTINLVFMLFEVEIEMDSAKKGTETPMWLWIVNIVFTVLFGMEILTRIYFERKAFLYGPHWAWNVFDSLVVVSQVVDMLLSTVSVGFIRVLRTFRMLRAFRIIKTARYVRDLRLMLAALAASLPSLSWALLLIALVVVLYAMFVQQVVGMHVEEHGLSGVNPKLLELYGSLGTSMLTLFMSVTGGADWGDLVGPLREISVAYLITFVLFLAFLLLGMLNILTAVFVESTNKLSDLDADLVIMEQLDQETSALNNMKALLREVDTNGSGTITEQEFEKQLTDPRFKAQMQLLDLHLHEARGLFHLLDSDGSGEVDIHEMIHTLMRLKGTAKSLDMATMLYENKRVFSLITQLAEMTECHFNALEVAMQANNGDVSKLLAGDPGLGNAGDMPDVFLSTRSGPGALAEITANIDRFY